MTGNARAMVLGSLVADALALGVHWVYNTNVIVRKYGRVEDMIEPKMASFHRGKEKGDFTHIGDQAMLLLASIAENGGFNLENFATEWLEFMQDYTGYLDEATRVTLSNFEVDGPTGRSGSPSAELSAASRIAPLVYRYRGDVDELLNAIKAQAAMTHNNSQVLESAAFLARAAVGVLGGARPSTALADVARRHFKDSEIAEWVEDGLDSAGVPTGPAIADFGQACAVEMGLPGAIHLIATYEDNFEDALVENIMAGGDSAARGMAVGMILGAYHGMAAIPRRWLADLKAESRICEMLDQIDNHEN